jgi:hypothetical protein
MFVNSISRIPVISKALSNIAVDELLDKADILEAEAKSLEAIAEAMRAEDARLNPEPIAGKAPPNYANVLSQIRTKSRNMGDKLARKVEAAMKKPKNWMDQLQEAEVSLEGKEAGQIVTAMSATDREVAMRILRTMNEANPKKSAASPFGPIPRGGSSEAETTRRAPKPKRGRGRGNA